MPVAFLTSFYLTSSTHFTRENRKCVAYKDDETRCGRPIAECNLARVHKLHERVRENDKGAGKPVDDEDRRNILERIAGLSLCGSHNKDNDIRAAACQWADEIQSRVRNIHLGQPKKARRKTSDSGSCFKLQFEPYHTCDGDSSENKEATTGSNAYLDRIVDEKIIRELLRKIERHDPATEYLYVFTHPAADGVYKVGHTNNLQRRNREHARCYHEIVLHCLVQCPNAQLYETLLQAEYKQARRKHKCKECKATHGEWFEAPLEELVYCVNTWALFARMLCCNDISTKVAQLRSTPTFDPNPYRWRKWALEWAEKWSRLPLSEQSSPLTPEKANGPYVHDDAESEFDQKGNTEYFLSPVPELSPDSGSSPASPDGSASGPATPTPSSRIHRRLDRSSSVQPIAKGCSSPKEGFTTTRFAADDSQTTLLSLQTDVKDDSEADDIFYSPVSSQECFFPLKSTTEKHKHTPRHFVPDGDDLVNSDLAAVDGVGVTGPTDLINTVTGVKADPFDMSDMLRDNIFKRTK
ncbi:GIY-YIG nuclease family protein [Aspergillus undulatus]|uniref:GIY-YIG nuclease family protein n=1 Tax=Aspergillus undulatus TaxID=1810928 RepID=UPI003CCE3194